LREPLLQPHRLLLREGALTHVYASKYALKSDRHPRVCFLFNDAFLWVNPSFDYRGFILLAHCDVGDEAEARKGKRCVLRVLSRFVLRVLLVRLPRFYIAGALRRRRRG
jgi:hypothetical protein